ncbi:MAG: hypothetical protein NWR66_04320 [Burkholderiaceae bacterium]|nr:hypothetical protein [Burkholderiaceae bacterium]
MGRHRGLLVVAAVIVLSGCGQAPDAVSSSAAKPDQKPYAGADNNYAEKTFTSGDSAGWQTAITERAQSQNDYIRSRSL